ncbi:hypothetical protein DIRU0_C20802 [Diutina rugosa]
MAPSNWLPWGNKSAPDNATSSETAGAAGAAGAGDNDDDTGAPSAPPAPADYNEEGDVNDDDELPDDDHDTHGYGDNAEETDDGTNERDDGVNEEEEAGSRRRKGWTFWKSSHKESDDEDKGSPAPKPKSSKPSANTIIPLEEPEDAVLYKPHDNATQFERMNADKNTSGHTNCVVPDWDDCLPSQRAGLAAVLFGDPHSTQNHSASTSTGLAQPEQPAKVDLGGWREYLSSLSSRLGFGSSGLAAVVDSQIDPQSEDQSDAKRLEQEVNLLYEKTYKLYGKCLQKLPPRKRACLPNYSKHFDPTDGLWVPTSDSETEPNPEDISIQDDPMGNMLINHRRRQQHNQNHTATEIQTTTSGQLRKIKKILIIGVHGFFPTKMIRPIIGAPKGTSLKFANEAERAILRYCRENGLISEKDPNDLSIQKIALEKEGKIFDRVGFFTEVLIKWRQELNDADFIFIAAHSQGCVVSIILLARLIAMGILENPLYKRIGILGMAGINNGPFYGADSSLLMKAYSTIEHDSMLELFELTKFDSDQSVEYKQSMQIIVNCNVKICFIGSINDQLVPLYSALASHVFHPNIYRGCYIDHSSNTPAFIKKLVSLCCHLQNLGYFDNNVIKELSPSLAGPMTGGGHSKIYNDGKVYDIGLKFVLDTDDIVVPPAMKSVRFLGYDPKPHRRDILGVYGSLPQPYGGEDMGTMIVKIPESNQVYIKEFNVSKIGSNPYILPWCLRGLLFNIERNWPNTHRLLSVDSGKSMGTSGYDEINELHEDFEHWKPVTKQMKELKHRLNGMRMSPKSEYL